METNACPRLSRVTMLAVAAAVISATPLFAQQPAPALLPPRPLPVPALDGGAEVGASATLPPTGTPVDAGPILVPADAGRLEPVSPTAPPPRVWNVAPTSRQAPPMSPAPTMAPQTPVWQVRPSAPTAVSVNPPTGWRNNAKPTAGPGAAPGTDAPAAMLAVPRGAITPTARPDWNWHGYDTYNQIGRAVHTQPAPNSAQADMAPYMKYAHLWHLSQNGFAAPPAAAAATPPANMPLTVSAGGPAAPVGNPNVEWRGTGDGQSAPPAEPSGWNTSGVAAANFADNGLPTRPAAPVVVDPPRAPGSRIPLQVRERISEICAGKARNLIVEQVSPIRLRIAFMVKEQQDAETLTTQLAALSELAPFKVDFEVQIGQ